MENAAKLASSFRTPHSAFIRTPQTTPNSALRFRTINHLHGTNRDGILRRGDRLRQQRQDPVNLPSDCCRRPGTAGSSSGPLLRSDPAPAAHATAWANPTGRRSRRRGETPFRSRARTRDSPRMPGQSHVERVRQPLRAPAVHPRPRERVPRMPCSSRSRRLPIPFPVGKPRQGELRCLAQSGDGGRVLRAGAQPVLLFAAVDERFEARALAQVQARRRPWARGACGPKGSGKSMPSSSTSSGNLPAACTASV